MKMTIGDGLNTGVAALKASPVPLIVGLLVAAICAGIPLVGLALGGPVFLGYYKMIVKGRKGQPMEIGDIFEPVKTAFLPSWVAMFMLFLVIFVGYIPILIIAFIPVVGRLAMILGPFYMLAVGFFASTYISLLALNNTTDWKKTMGEAIAFLKTDTMGRVLFLLVLSIVGGVGAILLGIGALVTYPIALVGIVAGIGAETGALSAPAAQPAAAGAK